MLIPCDYCGTYWESDKLGDLMAEKIERCTYCAWMERKAGNLLKEAEAIAEKIQ
jgi:hypothetical protein